MARAFDDDQYDGLPPQTLITKDDIAALGAVMTKTVEAWLRQHPDFPTGVYKTDDNGARLGQEKWYPIGEVTHWMCRHGRLDCTDIESEEQAGPTWYTSDEICEALNIRPITLRVWTSKGKFPACDERRAKSPYWSAATLETWATAAAVAAS